MALVAAVVAMLAHAGTAEARQAYVVDPAANAVSVVDTGSGTVVGEIAVREPGRIAMTPDGRLALVTSHLDQTVSVIDTQTGHVVNTIPVGMRPNDIAISPDGATAYVLGTT